MRYTPYRRTSEGHVAVRFGDAVLKVFLDDEDVSNNCTEAHVDEGWVLLCDKHTSKLRNRMVSYKVYGKVRIEGEIKDEKV